MLDLRDIVAGYGDTTVLRRLSLTIPAASVTALLGPNGAGKTTLLRTVSGLVAPVSGRVSLDGRDVTALRPHRRAALGLCHVPEGRGVFRSLTVRENLVMQSRRGEEHHAVERAVDAFPQLGDRIDQRVGTLSGGEQQMLALARTYVTEPRLILIDEASLGLAPRLVDAVFEFLHRLVTEQGVALLLVDQFVTRALDIATNAYVLRQGELVFRGTAAELRSGDVFSTYLGTSPRPT